MYYLRQHLLAISTCWKMLIHSRFNSILTISAIAISICLPSAFYLITQQFTSFKQEWDTASKITVYLKANTQEQQAISVAQLIEKQNQIERVTILSPDEVWKQVSKDLSISDSLTQDILDSGSPLPYTLLITSKTISLKDSQDISAFKNWLESIPEVNHTQLDLEWIETIRHFATTAQKLIFAVGLILIIGMVLIISNTIKAEISRQYRMIKVQLLCGLSYIFIKRPFLYLGFIYGLLGSILALIMLITITDIIDISSAISLHSNSTSTDFAFFILFIGCFTGWVASLWSMSFHIKNLQER